MFCFKPSTLLFTFPLIFFPWNPADTSNICIYGDDGVTQQSIEHVQKTFHTLLEESYKFKILKAPEIIEVSYDADQVKCDGGGGALGHPVVWYTFDGRNDIECGYCDRLFLKKSA